MKRKTYASWGNDKDGFVRLIGKMGLVLGSFGRGIPDLVAGEKWQQMFPSRPEPGEWLRYYEPAVLYSKWNATLARLEGASEAEAAVVEQQTAAIIQTEKLDWEQLRNALGEEERQQIRKLHHELVEEVDGRINRMSEEFIEDQFETPTTEQTEMIKSCGAVQFLMEVQAPCIAHHAVFPHELMAAARSGNTEAVGLLLQLDKMALADPTIHKIVRKTERENPRQYQQHIAKSMSRPLPILQGDEFRIAVFASFCPALDKLESRSFKFTAPDMIRGYDAIEEAVSGERGARDPHLQENHDSVKRGLLRKKNKGSNIRARYRDID